MLGLLLEKVSEQSYNELLQNLFFMGLGWHLVDMMNGRHFLGHNGSILGFASAYMRFPAEEMSVILLCNSEMVAEPHRLAVAIADKVIASH